VLEQTSRGSNRSHPQNATATQETHMPDSSADAPLADHDALYLRRAIELAAIAASQGNRPFGAVIATPEGEVLGEGWNNVLEHHDCTGHAEVNALRLASPVHARERLAAATLYASGEPCVMCAGAIFWSGIRRVVFGLDAERLRAFRRMQPGGVDIAMGCREVFAASPERVEVIGPALSAEATAPHANFWSR
jgi:tRNA(adenine34) deaminase